MLAVVTGASYKNRGLAARSEPERPNGLCADERPRPRSEVIGIFGPTASGKTAVAEAVAELLATEVVSADALQVYRELPILTNQPRRATRLVGIRSVADEMSVGEYAVLAHAAVDELVASRGAAVVAGGTGLYLRAALADLAVPPAPPAGARERWEAVYDADPAAAHARLQTLDARAAAVVHRNDRRRVVRALELAEAGSSLVPAADRLWAREMRRPTTVAGLDVPAAELERRIRARTKEMIARGAVAEARAALAGRISPTAAKALGLRDLAELPLEEATERIVVRTRRYAAYQRKWMRRMPGIVMLDGTLPPKTIAAALVAATTRRAG